MQAALISPEMKVVVDKSCRRSCGISRQSFNAGRQQSCVRMTRCTRFHRGSGAGHVSRGVAQELVRSVEFHGIKAEDGGNRLTCAPVPAATRTPAGKRNKLRDHGIGKRA